MKEVISSFCNKGGTGSSFPETVAFCEKRLLKIFAFSLLSVITSPFSIIGGTVDIFVFGST